MTTEMDKPPEPFAVGTVGDAIWQKIVCPPIANVRDSRGVIRLMIKSSMRGVRLETEIIEVGK